MKIRRHPTQQMENGNTWTLVEVLDDEGRVVYSEDFITNYQPNHSRVVTDKQGRMKLTDGRFVTREEIQSKQESDMEVMSRAGGREQPEIEVWEFERESFTIDVDAEIDALIDRWLATVRDDGESVAEKLESGKLRGSRVDASAVTSLRQQPEPWVSDLRSSVVERAIPADGRRKS